MGPRRKSGDGSSSSQTLHKVATKPGRGVRLTSQTKQVVENVRSFFEKEKVCRSTINRMAVVKRTAEATGISERCVRDIHKEYVARDSELLTPVKRYSVSRIRINPDAFDREVIRRVVHGFYRSKEYPTITGILQKVKEQCGFPGGRYCMWRVLRDMGFTYKKRDNKKYVYEQPNILEQRHTYLRNIRRLRQENRNLIYTDETWVNAHHNNEYIWIDRDGTGGWKVPSGKGQRLIILHAGGVEGWVDGADLVFRSKTNSADYHDEMNSEHYMEWLTEQLLPRLEGPSVIILDNASYHNKQKDKPPTSKDRKDDIKAWLDKHNVAYSDTDIKKTLLQKVKEHRPTPLYLTDEATNEHGHSVLRLSVAHCELNPIELAWASVKKYIAKHNVHYTLKEVETLTPDAFAHTTTDMWRNFCRHVVDVENDYISKDGIVEDTLEEMTLTFTADSDDDSDIDNDSDSENDMIDEDDRHLIDNALQQSTSTDTDADTDTTNSTNPRRNLAQTLQQFDANFLESVLPLQ